MADTILQQIQYNAAYGRPYPPFSYILFNFISTFYDAVDFLLIVLLFFCVCVCVRVRDFVVVFCYSFFGVNQIILRVRKFVQFLLNKIKRYSLNIIMHFTARQKQHDEFVCILDSHLPASLICV